MFTSLTDSRGLDTSKKSITQDEINNLLKNAVEPTGSSDELTSKLRIKVDWLSFTLPPENDLNKSGSRFKMLDYLGYDFAECEELSGRYFYNSGLTYGNYLNIYYDDYTKKVSKYSAKNVLYVWTGQGSTDLAQKLVAKYGTNWETAWFKFFEYIKSLDAKVSRIDLAVDSYHHELDLDHIERRLKRGEFKSKKKRWNVVKQRDRDGNVKSFTIYVGQSRGKSSKNGGSFVRFYDKYAESVSKAVVMPDEVENVVTGEGTHSWIRAEQQYNKLRAQSCVEEILKERSFGKVYMGTMRATVEFLKPSRKNKDKKTWKTDPSWEKFLHGVEKIQLSNPERDLTLGRLLRWIRVAVVPSLHLLDELGDQRGFNIYQLIRACKIPEYQKKQKRLFNDAMVMPDRLINFYLKEFLEGYGKDEN